MDPSESSRRPLKTRNARWAGALAASLARAGVSPNAISIGSIGFAALAAGAFVGMRFVPWSFDAALFVAAVIGIQGRLLCNMLDGMVAVEGGKRTATGELFNEVPDRIADTLILVAAGCAADPHYGPTLGWTAALLAMFTAYIRAAGRAATGGAYFQGPMAKPHRMAALTIGCVVALISIVIASCTMSGHNAYAFNTRWPPESLSITLVVIVVGCIATAARRLGFVAVDLIARWKDE